MLSGISRKIYNSVITLDYNNNICNFFVRECFEKSLSFLKLYRHESAFSFEIDHTGHYSFFPVCTKIPDHFYYLLIKFFQFRGLFG